MNRPIVLAMTFGFMLAAHSAAADEVPIKDLGRFLDCRDYALAQGSLVVNGYRFDSNLNREQKNYPTAGVLPNGATVEVGVESNLVSTGERIQFILRDPDATTAARIADAINRNLGSS